MYTTTLTCEVMVLLLCDAGTQKDDLTQPISSGGAVAELALTLAEINALHADPHAGGFCDG